MLVASLSLMFANVVTLTPTDDIWAYPHATDPQRDAYLRVWGVGGMAVAESASDTESFSYSLLQFNTGKVPAGKKLTAAKLILTHIANPSFTVEGASKTPLEVRAVEGEFKEKGWTYESLFKLKLDSKETSLFGATAPKFTAPDAEFKIEIDLLSGKGNFAKYLAGRVGGPLSLVLTTKLSMDENRQTYKIFSKDAEREAARPVLELTFED